MTFALIYAYPSIISGKISGSSDGQQIPVFETAITANHRVACGRASAIGTFLLAKPASMLW